MKTPKNDHIRAFLLNWFFTPLHGMAFGEWMRFLKRHHFAIDPQYWPRAGLVTAGSVFTSAFAWCENRTHAEQIRNITVQPPLFILGHWRSGTTFLHNLIARDQQFTYPTIWQVLNPHTFLTTERMSSVVLSYLAPKKRLWDNVQISTKTPTEDQFATTYTLQTPFLRWAFPRSNYDYDQYLTFRDVSSTDVENWKDSQMLFYKKLAWRDRRRLLLKSPPHTARVKLLLDMFPDAQFIHICRNPYAVFRSTKKQVDAVARMIRLQKPSSQELDHWIIQRYNEVYDAFFEDRTLIPDHQFYEMRYEELVSNPVQQVEQIYQYFDIPHFDAFRPVLQKYAESLKHYQRNEYTELPTQLRHTIASSWKRSFETWGYAYE